MKKLIGVFAMSAMMFGMVACGSSETKEANQEEVAVQEEVMLQDTVATATEESSVEASTEEVSRGEGEGFGRCLVSGCHCKEFEGRGQTCRNCGHAYKKHY
ncbi:MAG: hypothetical protein ACI30S_02735 [Muribaculaceae bacterium]